MVTISGDTDNIRSALENILSFIRNETSYVNITNQYNINLANTMTASQTTFSDATALGHELAALFDTWNQLQSGVPDEMAESIFRRLVVQIDTSSDGLARLKQASSTLNVAANEVIGDLTAVSQQLHTQLATEQGQMQNLQASLAGTAQEINQIHEQLSGSSGFWEGFLTGITAGIYSGLRDKLNQQNALRSTYISQLQQLQLTSQQTQQDIQTINQIDPVLSSANTLDAGVVSLENTLQTLSALAQQTEHDADRITGTENGKVAEFYHNRFNNDMTALLEWQNLFPA